MTDIGFFLVLKGMFFADYKAVCECFKSLKNRFVLWVLNKINLI